jgi:4-hydroxy 2-oxovalerate aldolase
MKILDCTLRDGGYYTNWDFDDPTTITYFESMNELPVEYLEIGYRSIELKGYYGKFFYCPIMLLEKIRKISRKKIVIILNEKDIRPEHVENLLNPCVGLVDMVRMAIDPQNLDRAIILAREVKKLGFEVGFNVMYMSEWDKNTEFLSKIGLADEVADIFYMVDSYGGVFPEDIKRIFNVVRSKTKLPIGFHGHNNLELGLINTLTAIECGCEMVDTTITGMGRGAGNLKTELLLTVLNATQNLDVDFNALSIVVDSFQNLQRIHDWGTSLPYMVSGANSLPQKEVMDWMGKRYFSLNSIIRALNNQSQGRKDNEKLPSMSNELIPASGKALLIGGGRSLLEHKEAIKEFIKANPDMIVIHASSKNIEIFNELNNPYFFCLMGNEGYRLEKAFRKLDITNSLCVLPPFPRQMGTYIPMEMTNKAYELDQISIADGTIQSQTSMALEIILMAKISTIFIAGYDGYSGSNISQKDQELFIENGLLFDSLKTKNLTINSITPSRYRQLKELSVYQLI